MVGNAHPTQMAEARVESIDALKLFKTALVKFAEGTNVAIGDSESEVIRTINWLENEQTTYWQTQVRKRTEIIGRCQEAVRMKRLYKDSSGRPQSAVEEEKALKVAQRMLEEAQQKVVAIRKAIRRIEKDFPLYKGSVQRFATDLVVLVPTATAHLENLVLSLEAYTSLSSPAEVTSTASIAGSEATGIDHGESMKRAVDEAPKSDEAPKTEEPPQEEAKKE